MEEIVIQNINTRNINRKGQKWFLKYNDELKDRYNGKAIVIEVESGEYFIGEDGIQATEKAREKYPNKIFFLGRIGYDTFFSFGQGRIP